MSARALVAAAVAVATLAVATPGLAGAGLRSIAVDCSLAGVRTVLTADAELDPSCTYTAGFEITASGVTLDCQGARVAGPDGVAGVGILVHAPTDVALTDVTVTNCDVSGFTNAIKVTRDGFRSLPDDGEFEHPFADIDLADNVVHDTRGVGIYVDGYVSGVTIHDNEVRATGSSGIYLETGSKQSLVEDNWIHDNGYVENGPGGREFNLGGTTFWFWGVGREGISIDGSYENTVRGNTFEGNSAGGVLLYKNCGEYPDRNPDRWFDRRDHADDNLIEDNEFLGGRNGVWVGSRMGENTLPMECSDPAYVEEGTTRVVLDHAERNTIRGNRFVDVTYGVRVEDDDTTVADNRFEGTSADHHAVIIGTPHRTDVLQRPVRGTVLTGNRSDIEDNDSPYRWVHGEVDTTVSGNRALGEPTGICEGVALPRQVFVMVIAVALAPADGTKPATPDLTVDTVGALPSCRSGGTATTTTSATTTTPGSTPVEPAPAEAIEARPTYAG